MTVPASGSRDNLISGARWEWPPAVRCAQIRSARPVCWALSRVNSSGQATCSRAYLVRDEESASPQFGLEGVVRRDGSDGRTPDRRKGPLRNQGRVLRREPRRAPHARGRGGHWHLLRP
jgi:hypothetical protein